MTSPSARRDGGASVPAVAASTDDGRAWATAPVEAPSATPTPHGAPRPRSEAPAELDPDAVVVPREMPAETGPTEARRGPAHDPVAARQIETGTPLNDPLGELDRQPAVVARPPGQGLPGSPTPSRPVHASLADSDDRAAR